MTAQVDFGEGMDDLSYNVVDFFLKKHDFPVLDDRLLSNFRGKLDSVDVLREIWLDQMENNPEKLVDLYEKIYERKESPHYENLIDTVLIQFVIAVISTVIGGIVVEEYSQNRSKIINKIKEFKIAAQKNKAKLRNILEKYEKSLKYLFRVYALKAYFEKNRLRFSEFLRIREVIKNAVYSEKRATYEIDYERFESQFIKKHALPGNEESYSQKFLEEFLQILLESNKPVKKNRAKVRRKHEPLSNLYFTDSSLRKILEGLAVKHGYAIGKVAVVKSGEDCDKVEEGDIMVLIQHCPDFVPASRISGALIGDKGGFTSHTAIVGRELEKPTIVGTETGTEVLKDGQYVFVDAFRGIVYEIF